jgi:hypothetical protein
MYVSQNTEFPLMRSLSITMQSIFRKKMIFAEISMDFLPKENYFSNKPRENFEFLPASCAEVNFRRKFRGKGYEKSKLPNCWSQSYDF